MLRREQIERLKERYPAGTVVRLGQMEGEHQMPSGMEGKVIGVISDRYMWNGKMEARWP